MPHSDIPGSPGFHDVPEDSAPRTSDRRGGRGGGRGGFRDTSTTEPRDRWYRPESEDPDIGIDIIRRPRIVYIHPDGTRYTALQLREVIATITRGGYTGRGIPAVVGDDFWDTGYYVLLKRDLDNFLLGYNPDGTLIDPYIPGGTGPGGTGGVRARYAAPDRGAVEEYVKDYSISVLGNINDALVQAGVTAYMNADRVGFSATNNIDPTLAMKESFRTSNLYKDIHHLRADSVDETTWVPERQKRLRTMGLHAGTAEELGIQLARVGASGEAVQDAGEKAFLQSTGRVHAQQRSELKAAGMAVLRLV